MRRLKSILRQVATTIVVASVVFACTNDSTKGKIDFSKTPLQVVDDMYIVRSENGLLKMRVAAARMERYDMDTMMRQVFPKGITVYSYNENGELETTIVADRARHDDRTGEEDTWMAFGNVVVRNIIKKEIMETDTLYWDMDKDVIHTDCYVRLYSPDGFMQGYGMVSDQKEKNSVILKPFNSYGIVERDSTEIIVDSINFIGPMLKK